MEGVKMISPEKGFVAAVRASAAIQLGTQLLLWIFFDGYDRTEQTIWQAVLMLLLPLLANWALWRWASVAHEWTKWVLLPLIFCFALDAALMAAVLAGFIRQLIPTYPAWLGVVLPMLFCFAAALFARERGVCYGSLLLIVPLVVLVLLGTVFLRASTRADRLWPILGDGPASTAKAALSGAGAVWGAALLFVNQSGEKDRKGSIWWCILPWMLCAVCALWFGFLRPWSAGDELPIGETMMGLARHAHSVILYEATGIMWMLLVPASLAGCLSSSGQIIRRAFPRMPVWLTLLPVSLAAAVFCLVCDEPLAVLSTVLAWRWVISAACGLTLLLFGRRCA